MSRTHRQRILFNAFRSLDILKRVPNLNLTLDLSHWIISSERLLNEETEFYWKKLEKYLIKNSGLIHARISTLNQIQVFDPDFYQEYETYFYNIWKKIIKNSKKEIIYINYEYGPEPYLFMNPYNDKPFRDVSEIMIDQLYKFKEFLNE